MEVLPCLVAALVVTLVLMEIARAITTQVVVWETTTVNVTLHVHTIVIAIVTA